MVLINKNDIYLDKSECLVNFINHSQNCVEPLEMTFRDWFPQNYVSYITRGTSAHAHPLQYFNSENSHNEIGGIYFDYNQGILTSNRVIFNSVLYDNPRAQLDDGRVSLIVANIIKLALMLNIKSIGIPVFDSYNVLVPRKNIERSIIDMFRINAPHIHLSLYV